MQKINKLDPSKFESKWQNKWEKERVYQPDLAKAKKPYYNLMMFPYPSAEGLHVGNMYAFTGADINGRYRRMKGFDVFEPIGLDGFGIHSENYAIKIGKHPKEQAKVSQKNFYRQLHAIGNGFAWENTLETYDPDYYRWTQWIFVTMFKHGLAYRKKSAVNFCPSCKTVLSDEQVINGACERCKTMVEKRTLDEWFFRITSYARKLLENTYKDSFQWTQKVKTGQRNWIGKKEGINITYPLLNESGQELTSYLPRSPRSEAGPVKAGNPPASPAGRQLTTITVFTTRPDTNFGATFVVVGPEHPLVDQLLAGKIDAQNILRPDLHAARVKQIREYVQKAKATSEMERIAAGRKKTGVATGLFAVNQLTGYKMPVYVSDFVLGHVGTGAVVGVPGHDVRDFEFAKEFNLPILRVVIGPDGDNSEIRVWQQVQEEEGTMVNSDFLNGKNIKDAISLMMDHLEKKGWGKRVTTYKLRDWCISRQRYWGAPIPMIFCSSCAKKGTGWLSLQGEEAIRHLEGGRLKRSGSHDSFKVEESDSDQMSGWFPVPESDLPVRLPPMDDWKPEGTGKGPLAKVKSFVETACPNCGSLAQRETDVCDTFLDSSWYHLRYPSVSSPKSPRLPRSPKEKDSPEQLPWHPEVTRKWLPVTQYIGGAEHTVLHLLYARFVWMCFYDWGYFNFSAKGRPAFGWDEPYTRFYAHGLIIAEGAKMSKSRGNVVIPDEYIAKYGADTLRTYLMFLGPFDQGGDFRDTGIAGMYRFLNRVWRLVQEALFPKSPKLPKRLKHDDSLTRSMHHTIKEVSEDMVNFRYNTAIAHLMEYVNALTDNPQHITHNHIKSLLLMLAPFAPHLTEELWQKLRHLEGGRQVPQRGTRHDSFKVEESIHRYSWPSYEEKYLRQDTVTIVVQVNGKVRDTLSVQSELSNKQPDVEKQAKQSGKIASYLGGSSIRKVIFVPGKLINFVL